MRYYSFIRPGGPLNETNLLNAPAWQIITHLIETVGFPIFIATYILVVLNKSFTRLNTAIDALTALINSYLSHLNPPK